MIEQPILADNTRSLWLLTDTMTYHIPPVIVGTHHCLRFQRLSDPGCDLRFSRSILRSIDTTYVNRKLSSLHHVELCPFTFSKPHAPSRCVSMLGAIFSPCPTRDTC